MKTIQTLICTLVLFVAAPANAAPAPGPLRVLRSNPRYFTDGSGRAVYLTGSHTWCNFATDQGKDDPPAAFNFNAYLDFLAAHNHNFFRGWVWDLAWSNEGGSPNGLFRWSPHPWLRTGPGNATDGQPKFDLDPFNQAFFDRIRSRTIAARDRAIYVSIMLFQGYAVQCNRNAKDGFPLDGRNNINGGDAGAGHAANTLENAAVTARQDAYVKTVVDADRAYLFLTSLNGKMWRLWTSLADFPKGFGHCELALEAKIFEASHTYKLKGTDKYLTIIEENGRREARRPSRVPDPGTVF